MDFTVCTLANTILAFVVRLLYVIFRKERHILGARDPIQNELFVCVLVLFALSVKVILCVVMNIHIANIESLQDAEVVTHVNPGFFRENYSSGWNSVPAASRGTTRKACDLPKVKDADLQESDWSGFDRLEHRISESSSSGSSIVFGQES